MKTDTIKDVPYYESLPYTIVIRKDDEGDFVARIAELPGCLAHGESESSAVENLRSMQRLWLEEALSAGDTIPEPEDDTGLPSGKWLQRVPRRLHRDLANRARRDNVSLNQLVTSMLSEALTVRSCAHAFEAILAKAPRSIHPLRDMLICGWWGAEPANEARQWSISHGQGGNILQGLYGLPRSKNLSPKQGYFLGVEHREGTNVLLDQSYIDEHTEGQKHLARK
jgi:antitoxin HicB